MKNFDLDYIQRLVDRFNSKYDFNLSFVPEGNKILFSLNDVHIFCCSSMQEVNVCYRTIYRMIDSFIAVK